VDKGLSIGSQSICWDVI